MSIVAVAFPDDGALPTSSGTGTFGTDRLGMIFDAEVAASDSGRFINALVSCRTLGSLILAKAFGVDDITGLPERIGLGGRPPFPYLNAATLRRLCSRSSSLLDCALRFLSSGGNLIAERPYSS